MSAATHRNEALIAEAWAAIGFTDSAEIDALDDDTKERLGIDYIDGDLASRGYGGLDTLHEDSGTPSDYVSFTIPCAASVNDSAQTKVRQKITDNGGVRRFLPTKEPKKLPTKAQEKLPTDWVPVLLWVVVSIEELEKLLKQHGQEEWISRPRILGLLLLMDFFIRQVNEMQRIFGPFVG